MISIGIGDGIYPKLLKNISDPPEILYCEGNTELLNRVCVSVVGSREASPYGLNTAREIGCVLGMSGICVVSGLAYGIDMAAHEGACDTRGGTIAVLGSGIDMERSERKRVLFDRISKEGLVISEYPPGMPASRFTFPRRNRIISGLSVATCVVEAGLYSGSLITAECAAEQGRDVYAVPGNIDSPMSLGTNRLIRDGALALLNPYDICRQTGIQRMYDDVLGQDEQRILDILMDGSEKTLAEISKVSGYSREQVKGIVSVLEMKGIVCVQSGRAFVI